MEEGKYTHPKLDVLTYKIFMQNDFVISDFMTTILSYEFNF